VGSRQPGDPGADDDDLALLGGHRAIVGDGTFA
jgi:hypothetical protein